MDDEAHEKALAGNERFARKIDRSATQTVTFSLLSSLNNIL